MRKGKPMSPSPAQIAALLDHRIVWPRSTTHSWGYPAWIGPSPRIGRPTVDQLATELLSDAEFRALGLGTWLGTTDGQIITAAVEMMSPPLYREDIELLVAGLRRAADLQQIEGQQTAGRFALAVVGLAGLVAIGVAALRPSTTA